MDYFSYVSYSECLCFPWNLHLMTKFGQGPAAVLDKNYYNSITMKTNDFFPENMEASTTPPAMNFDMLTVCLYVHVINNLLSA